MTKLSSKEEALREVEATLKEFGIAESTFGRVHFGNPSFVMRLRDPKSDITTTTLDRIFHVVVQIRGQRELEL